MATAESEPKTRITARVPASVQEMLETAAAYLGVPLNSFMVTAAVEKASDLLVTERVIKLGRRDTELFARLLENPPVPNAAMLEAKRIHKRMIRE